MTNVIYKLKRHKLLILCNLLPYILEIFIYEHVLFVLYPWKIQIEYLQIKSGLQTPNQPDHLKALVIHSDFLLSLFLHTCLHIEIQFMSRNSLTFISITNKDSFFNSIQDQCFDDDLHSRWQAGKTKKLYPMEPCSRVLH